MCIAAFLFAHVPLLLSGTCAGGGVILYGLTTLIMLTSCDYVDKALIYSALIDTSPHFDSQINMVRLTSLVYEAEEVQEIAIGVV